MVAIESSFNPLAESEHGAKGLMQVMAKFHMDKIAMHGDTDMVKNGLNADWLISSSIPEMGSAHSG